MKNLQDIIDKLSTDKYSFIIRRLVVQGDIDKAVEVMLDIATQEEPIKEIPTSWWQAFKLEVLYRIPLFHRLVKHWFPVKMAWVYAITKFPELQVPQLGRSYLHLQVIDTDKLMREFGGEAKE